MPINCYARKATTFAYIKLYDYIHIPHRLLLMLLPAEKAVVISRFMQKTFSLSRRSNGRVILELLNYVVYQSSLNCYLYRQVVKNLREIRKKIPQKPTKHKMVETYETSYICA